MKVLLDIKDSNAKLVLKLLNGIPHVKARPVSRAKAKLITEIQQAVKEMQQIKAGKRKARNAEEFLNEL